MKELFEYLQEKLYGVRLEHGKLFLYTDSNIKVLKLIDGLNYNGNYEIILIDNGKYEIRSIL
jgi:hypothetical protein